MQTHHSECIPAGACERRVTHAAGIVAHNQQAGIRQYMSPPQEPRARNRRVIDSDSSEEQQPRHRPRAEEPSPAHGPAAAEQPPANLAPAQPPITVIVTVASDDSDDSMYIPLNRGTLQAPPHRAPPAAANTRPTPPRQTQLTPPKTQQPRRPTPERQRVPAARRLLGEAEEVSDDKISTTPDESDDNAAAMYRDAILGVRHRHIAMNQMRSQTTPCATCAKFADFLKNFI